MRGLPKLIALPGCPGSAHAPLGDTQLSWALRPEGGEPAERGPLHVPAPSRDHNGHPAAWGQCGGRPGHFTVQAGSPTAGHLSQGAWASSVQGAGANRGTMRWHWRAQTQGPWSVGAPHPIRLLPTVPGAAPAPRLGHGHRRCLLSRGGPCPSPAAPRLLLRPPAGRCPGAPVSAVHAGQRLGPGRLLPGEEGRLFMLRPV